MNEQLDKLIIRLFFAILICLLIYFYRYAHKIFYPSSRSQLIGNFLPVNNIADTIHLFSRILGIGIIFSNIFINVSDGIMPAIFDLFLKGVLGFVLYLTSIYGIESISLYNFEYSDEIQKRKNICYALVSFSQTVAIALVIQTVLFSSRNSLPWLISLWLYSMVLLGLAIRAYRWVSPITFNKFLIQKDNTLAFSYSGYVLGIAILIRSAFSSTVPTMLGFVIQVILNILIAIMIFPIFRAGIKWAFHIESPEDRKENLTEENLNIGYGVYEGILLFTAAYLTSVIINKVYFGSFYPMIETL